MVSEWVSEIAQSCPTLCYPMDCSLPGSSLHGILQARVLEWVAISFSRDLPDPGIEPGSPAFQADTLTSEPPGKPLKESGKWLQLKVTSCISSQQENQPIFETLRPGIYFSLALKVLDGIFFQYMVVLSTLQSWCLVEPPSWIIPARSSG